MADNSKPEDKPEECEFCEFETPDLKAYASTSASDEDDSHRWLCKLYASTPAGNACEYPRHYLGEANPLKAICFVGNTILAELRKLKAV